MTLIRVFYLSPKTTIKKTFEVNTEVNTHHLIQQKIVISSIWHKLIVIGAFLN